MDKSPTYFDPHIWAKVAVAALLMRIVRLIERGVRL